ncbi:hypothetical protein MPH47_15635 [Psychrobacillus psychrodurans]|uniref:hypothetical protein n=1 Tax=Psychrobacillus TaxID=1221880 RepID=UPI001F4E7318|nr:hypothetical protein [Psychrobacillus psychrodurans]MCK1998636.1 hypothetical protein [Psychrobacillus psychrodurans]
MLKKSSLLGLVAAIISIVLWMLLNFFNPYSNGTSNDTTLITLFMLVLPATLAIISSFTARKSLMLIAFIWSLPISLYMLMTPGIFLLFGITSFCYLLSYILMWKKQGLWNKG